MYRRRLMYQAGNDKFDQMVFYNPQGGNRLQEFIIVANQDYRLSIKPLITGDYNNGVILAQTGGIVQLLVDCMVDGKRKPQGTLIHNDPTAMLNGVKILLL